MISYTNSFANPFRVQYDPGSLTRS